VRRLRGEPRDGIAALAQAMRNAARTLDHPYDVIDTCGTGGDGARTCNISTAAALVLAGAGLKVAKHGNRAMSSKSGSSDVLGMLGVDLTAGLAQQRQALDEAGIAFLFAPAYHGAMRHVGPVRAEIGFRTVFNLLGPLSNPAGAKRQIMGVYDPRLLEPLAQVLGRLGATRAWTVHGQGLDELTTTGPTEVAEWKDGAVRRFTVTPEDAGLPRADIEALRGGGAKKTVVDAGRVNAGMGDRCAHCVSTQRGCFGVVAGNWGLPRPEGGGGRGGIWTGGAVGGRPCRWQTAGGGAALLAPPAGRLWGFRGGPMRWIRGSGWGPSCWRYCGVQEQGRTGRRRKGPHARCGPVPACWSTSWRARCCS